MIIEVLNASPLHVGIGQAERHESLSGRERHVKGLVAADILKHVGER
jgi:hypothetical protein